MSGMAWIFWISLCALIFSVLGQMGKLINRLKGRNDLRVFEAIRSGKDGDEDQELSKSLIGFESDVFLQGELVESTSKYQFISGKDVRGFLIEPETKSFTIQELFVCSDKGLNFDYSNDNQLQTNSLQEKVTEFDKDSDHSPDLIRDSKFSAAQAYDPRTETENYIQVAEANCEKEEENCVSAREINDQGKTEEPISLAKVDDQEKVEETISMTEVNDQEKAAETISVAEFSDQEKAEEVISVAEFNDQEKTEDSAKILCYEGTFEGKCVTVDEDMCYQIQLLPEDQKYETADNNSLFISKSENMEEMKEDGVHNTRCLDQESVQTSARIADVDTEFIELDPQLQNSNEKFTDEAQQLNNIFWDSGSDEEDGIDILLEHQNLVQQIKMEMRNSRIRCLPTISEECETPKMAEDLKPLKIDEKLEYKDRIEEIQKFYKCYAEKMRKLDILNYQTLNAISFLQLKDTQTFTLGKKSLFSSNKLFPMPSLRGNKLRRIYVDHAHKSIYELSHNLELVYVGQVCLSWEILCWQYGKTKELLEYDARGHHTYNHVAGEYLQFQVLVQRFVEDEPYQGHRLQFYAKNRCILRSFLQVPSLKDDCSKEKKVGYEEEETDIISLAKLSEIIYKTMHIFWEFLHADKGEASLALKGHSAQVDPAEEELLIDVTTTHQKKERKLKEILRSGNCIVKKLQKQQEGRVNHAMFIARVELRLIGKVLGLPRLTRDHLVWCKKKLDNINIVSRKVSVEPSCLLFPC